jgi:hypothetical protein
MEIAEKETPRVGPSTEASIKLKRKHNQLESDWIFTTTRSVWRAETLLVFCK